MQFEPFTLLNRICRGHMGQKRNSQSRREQEVGALQRREVMCTRWWICVMDQEGVGGRTMVDYECYCWTRMVQDIGAH
jgi:hypothetical protein